MTFQEISEFILKLINAITPIIVPLIPVILAIVIKRQNDSAKALATTQAQLATAQSAIETHTDENAALKRQQTININHITELETSVETLQTSQKTTHNENVRLSKLVEQSKRDTDELTKRLAALQEEYDAFKAKAAADKVKSDEDKRADMLVILGLRTELEKAHADAKQAQEDAKRWHEQSDMYELDYQQQTELTVRLEALYNEVKDRLEALKKQTDKLTPPADDPPP